MGVMFTREQYLDRECSHSQYYGQFVNESLKSLVLREFTIEQLKSSKDPHLNDWHNAPWDRLQLSARSMVSRELLKEAGEGWSLSTSICIMKEAARQLMGVENGINGNSAKV